jgi:two-component system, cell cycle sensor histidine kinase and response regulator CckA
MPVIGGKALFSRIEAILPVIKSLFISGYTDNAIVHHGILDSGIAFLQKPFTVDSLLRKVRKVLDA